MHATLYHAPTSPPAHDSPADPAAAARAAKLRYVSDKQPGIQRRRAANGFTYLNPDGSEVTDEDTLARIRKLAIPPAYEGVWICRVPNGHLQAVGRDARGRKQYRYHPRWRLIRDETKFGRMLVFGRILPEIRRRVAEDLAHPGLPREKVLAAIVRLLEMTLARVGNEEYVKANHSFGLTTLRNRHVRVDGNRLAFDFRGKHGIKHHIDLRDRRLARIVKRCRDIPGQDLFQYLGEDGEPHSVDSEDVNDYLREISGEEITAKDFRTWAATNLAALALTELEAFDTQAKAKKNVVHAVEAVAKLLGNTPAICRKCYIHPAIFDGYLDGSLLEGLKSRADETLDQPASGLSAEETAVAAFLSKRLGETIEGQKPAG
ncbi:MAG: DNA topoisomerase IB [Alphaproteobacteria bacterium]|nr:DNA topoisomerase IB [Alphaproteobacteria bacterium]